MRSSYIHAYHLISSLGFGKEAHWQSLINNQSGIRYVAGFGTEKPIPLGQIPMDKAPFALDENYTFLENLLIACIAETLKKQSFDYKSSRCLCLISTTKGNIDLLAASAPSTIPQERAELGKMAAIIQQHFAFAHCPLVVSNACISGVMGLLMAQRLVSSGQYDQVLVVGGDILSEFVIAGFNCLKAISDEPCAPFDKDRKGVSLGEAAACILVSSEKNSQESMQFELLGGAISNDANHISGPSRTGDGLAQCVSRTLLAANLSATDIDFVSAHGTATLYNDEMESKALQSLALSHVPLNSFKAYIGHTLGAAGVMEVAMSMMSMEQNMLIKSVAYHHNGVESPVAVIAQNSPADIQYTLKLSSGFGGCNASLIIKKWID